MRVAVLIALVGCGRVGFDLRSSDGGAGDSATDGGTPLTLDLPSGGEIDRIVIAPDASWYAVSVAGGIYRSDDHATWTACGAITATGIAFTVTSVYASGADVKVSNDRCATWQATGAPRYSQNVATVTGGPLYALADDGLYGYGGSTWQRVTTPADGNPFETYTDAGGLRIAGTRGGGVVHSLDGVTWTQETTGLATLNVKSVAASVNHAYLITEASGASSGGLSCAPGSATGWSICYGVGGTSVAIDPANDSHVLVAIYDNLLETTNAFTSSAAGKRGGAMGDSIVRDLTFGADSSVVAATDSGVYYAAPGTLAWEARLTGLASWNVVGIARAPAGDIYLATEGGVIHGAPGMPYTHSFAGMADNNEVNAVAAMPDGSVLAVGRHIWTSTDQGATWNQTVQLGATDAYRAYSIAIDGTRVYVGTQTELYSSDPPYTTWSQHLVAGQNRFVNGLVVTGGALWAATSSGLFESTDQAGSFSPVADIGTAALTSIAEVADGSVIAGDAANGVWVSDPGRTTWQHAGATQPPVFEVAGAGTTILASTDSGVLASTDRGATWTMLAAGLRTRALAIDPADSKLVVGTIGRGLVKVAIP